MNNAVMNQILFEISNSTFQAEKKHPRFAANEDRAIILALEELGEAAQALNDNDKPKARQEMLDCAAVIIRYLEHF